MKVHFLGGAGTVTGSKTLLEHNGTRILIDCGMFQGLKALRELNRESLPVPPYTIDFVILTHGHLDHCGWLPKLVKEGFDGKIYCSSPTKQIAQLILLDSAKIQEEEAEKANAEQYSKHELAEPLYTVDDAEKVVPYYRVVDLDTEIILTPDISFEFFYAAHILGACSISMKIDGKILVFSGDIGQDDDLLMRPSIKPTRADYVFLESTYGNRIHPEEDVLLWLERRINETVQNDGNIVIPSFAVERAQVMMYLIWQLKKQNRISKSLPCILDTPMGIDVLHVFTQHQKWHKLSLEDCKAMCDAFIRISDYKDTIGAIYDSRPKIVIAASGMITGGRVLSYLERYITRQETLVVMVGYQAEGTRGRKLLDGAKEIKIFGRMLPVAAQVELLESLSAHADQKDLLHWLSKITQAPKKIFLVHGENVASEELRFQIKERYGYDVSVPVLGQTIVL
jgi:metallo-beta-lactamase family protein